MEKKKKRFFETTVGKTLKGVASVLAPKLVDVLEGATSVEEALTIVKESDESPELKLKLQELVLQQYEAEVADRIAARQREANVAAAGGSDWLFKAVGIGITVAFLFMTASAMGLIDPPQTVNQRMWDVAFGAITAKMTAVVSYYFGSSVGSKQKTNLLK